ncbi:hypothetical protein RIF29_32716 [Crotalaria pallida]|uniref:Uncharacterized protein n=1 Tax=Crotalaria pallida TaxID=3830 RepID=A0AAN9EQM9_CROPI
MQGVTVFKESNTTTESSVFESFLLSWEYEKETSYATTHLINLVGRVLCVVEKSNFTCKTGVRKIRKKEKRWHSRKSERET